MLWGLLKACTLATTIVLMHNTTVLQGSRHLGSSYVPKCGVGCAPAEASRGLVYYHFIYQKLFYCRFLLRPVSQLCRGAEDALGSCRGANSAT